MALQVWLPLNGNLNNQGINKLNPVQSTAPTYVNGKIGKAMSTGAFYLPAADVAKFYNNEAMSFCFWIYPTTSGSVTVPIIGQSAMSAGDNRMYTIYQYPNGVDLHLSWQNETASGTFLSAIWSNVLTVNTWNHVAITYDGSTAILYVNGVVKGTTTGTSARSNFSYNVPIPNASSRYLNDIRIYDHCLSEKEVKEISKGLVVHYPLNNNGNNISNLVDNSGTFSGWSVGSGWTLGTSDNGTKMYSFSRTGATGNNWVRLIPTLRVNGNDYPDGITVSMELLTPDKSAINQTCLGSLQQYNESGSRTGWCEPGWSLTNVVNGKWSKISYSFTKAQLLTNSQGLVYSYTMFSFQLVQNGNISIRKIKIEPGTTATRYSVSDNDRNNPTIVYDTSGFKYDATRVGSATIVASSPKYESSMNFSNAGYLIKDTFGVTVNAFTLNFWVNIKSISAQHFIFGTFSSWTSHGIGVWRDSGSSTKYNCLIKSDSESSYSNQGITGLTVGTWSMITLVYTGTTYTGYLNSNQVFSVTYGSNGTITNPNFMVANSKYNSTPASENEEAYISDLRFYTTALSVSDIKELYQTSASIDNNGVLMAYNFNEE